MKTTPENLGSEKAKQYYIKACCLVEGQFKLHENQFPSRRNLGTRFKLWRAVRLFKKYLKAAPDNWQTMWLLGKTVQRLGNERVAFDWFVKAWDLEPRNADVAREAALSAMHLGLARHAIEYCEAALDLEPHESGLLGNLTLALMHAGRTKEALERAEEAVKLDPKDKVNENLLKLIRHINATGAICPPNSAQLDKYCQRHREIFR